jgi:hypothetical protein
MMIGPMNTIKAHLLTGGLTLLVGAILVAVWMHLYPLDIPRLARVDIGRLVAYQQQSLVQRIKPGLDAQEQAKLFEEAKAFGTRLDTALDQVSRECRCALINTAALLKTSDTRIPELTEQVAQVAGLSLPAPLAK